LPSRGVNVGYSLISDLFESGQLVKDSEVIAEGKDRLTLSGRGNDGPRQDFADKLSQVSDAELADMCAGYIWLSAYAANNPNSDYHWMVDAAYYECKRRGLVQIYSKAYDKVVRENT
jgi:hypothetical protein